MMNFIMKMKNSNIYIFSNILEKLLMISIYKYIKCCLNLKILIKFIIDINVFLILSS